MTLLNRRQFSMTPVLTRGTDLCRRIETIVNSRHDTQHRNRYRSLPDTIRDTLSTRHTSTDTKNTTTNPGDRYRSSDRFGKPSDQGADPDSQEPPRSPGESREHAADTASDPSEQQESPMDPTQYGSRMKPSLVPVP
jgi:hypothetical protein